MIEEIDIPDHWELEPLESTVEILDRHREPINSEEREKRTEGIDEGQLYPYYGAGGQIDWMDDYIFDDELILVAEDGATTGYTYKINGKSWVNNHAHVIKADESALHNDFLYYYLKQYNFDPLKTGATRPKLTQTNMKKVDIPVPPLDEQERIVATVEERLNAMEALEQSVKHVDEFSHEYEESLLAFLLAGKGDLSQGDINGLPSQEDIREEWDLKELDDVVEYHSNLVDPSKNPDEEYSLIELNDVEQNGRGLSNVQTKMGEDIGSNKREFNSNHVLYCKLRPYLNKVVKPNFEGIASSELLVFEPGEDISREYLYQYLSSPMVCNKAEFLMKGANQPRISKKELMEFNIPVPPKEQQEDVIQKMEMIQESELDKSLSNIRPLFEEYRESILTHAFRGEVEY